ncbi:MAG: hypothetical protein ABEJ98_03405 [Candidatus Nanohaloarchaea archaeon]
MILTLTAGLLGGGYYAKDAVMGKETGLNAFSNPSQDFNDLLAKEKSSTYQISYDTERIQNKDGFGFHREKYKVFRKKNRTKTLAKVMRSDTSRNAYYRGEKTVYCKNVLKEPGCEFANFTVSASVSDWLRSNRNYIEVSANGTKNVSGRICRKFNLDIEDDAFKSPETGEVKRGSGSVCLDKEIGYVSEISIEKVISHPVKGRIKKEFVERKGAELVSLEVSRAMVEVPKLAKVEQLWPPDQGTKNYQRPTIQITAFRDLENVKVTYHVVRHYVEKQQSGFLCPCTDHEVAYKSAKNITVGDIPVGETVQVQVPEKENKDLAAIFGSYPEIGWIKSLYPDAVTSVAKQLEQKNLQIYTDKRKMEKKPVPIYGYNT